MLFQFRLRTLAIGLEGVCFGMDMHHIAITATAVTALPCKIRFRDPLQRIRPAHCDGMGLCFTQVDTFRRFSGNAFGFVFLLRIQFFHHAFQHLADQHALFCAQAAVEYPHTVIVGIPGQFTQRMGPVFLLQGLQAICPAVVRDQSLDMTSGAIAGDVQQKFFIFACGCPGHGAYFGVTDAAFAKRG